MSRNNNYNGKLTIGSGLIPANKQEFPLMDAHDVLAGANNLRLDDALSGIMEALDNISTFDGVIEQTTGESTTAVMSQYAVTYALSNSRYIKNLVLKSNANVRWTSTIQISPDGVRRVLQYEGGNPVPPIQTYANSLRWEDILPIPEMDDDLVEK